jgi:hypothetical protein
MHLRKGFFDSQQTVFVASTRSASELKLAFGHHNCECSYGVRGATTTIRLSTSHFHVWKILAKTHKEFQICVRKLILPQIQSKMLIVKQAFGDFGALDAVMTYLNRNENRWQWI